MSNCKDLMRKTQVVVLMGGLGTRLGLNDRPKSMADVYDVPFFEYQLKLLIRWGFHNYLFLVGHRAENVQQYFGNGTKWGIRITYSADGDKLLGTAGAIANAYGQLDCSFILLYGDSFMDIDFQESVYRYQLARKDGKLGVMAVLENNGKYDKSNAKYQADGCVLYDKVHPSEDMRYIDYGVLVLSRELFADVPKNKSVDLADIIHAASIQGKIAGQVVTNRFYEIGSPASLEEFRCYAKERFYTAQRAVFLDRDGVINEIVYNEDIEQLDSPFCKEDFVYRDGILEVLAELQERGYWLFIVTNQPAAAKGKVGLLALYDLNAWMVQDLAVKGIQIRSVGMCPHYPEQTREINASFLIGACDCRKPGDALITDILSVYNIDTFHSYMIGDSYTDILAGKAAGIKTILLGNLKCDVCTRLAGNQPDYIAQDIKRILEAVDYG